MAQIATTISNVIKDAGNATVLTLSNLWIGLSMVRPASTRNANYLEAIGLKKYAEGVDAFSNLSSPNTSSGFSKVEDDKMYFMKLGEYIMPISQTFILQARKQLNVSSLVDGIDIIQQTRKEAKTIDCTLKLGLNTNRTYLNYKSPLQVHRERYDASGMTIAMLNDVLRDLFETDAVFNIENDYINNMFGVETVIMTKYEFKPKTNSDIFEFDFSLTEVKYGANVMTLDLGEIDSGQQSGSVS